MTASTNRSFALSATSAALLAVGTVLLAAGCGTTSITKGGDPVTGAPPLTARDCPEPPYAMTRVEQVSTLARYARETRANLMAGSGSGQTRLVATLHTPRLSLLEMLLRQSKALDTLSTEAAEPHLFRAHVQIVSAQPVAALDAPTASLTLKTAEGRRYPVLAVVRTKSKAGYVYRLPLAFPSVLDNLTRFSLLLRDGAGKPRKLLWGVSRRSEEQLDTLPHMFRMTRLRDLHLARRDILVGRFQDAQTLLDDVAACSNDLPLARELGARLKKRSENPKQLLDVSLGAADADEPGALRASQTSSEQLALALRIALVGRLTTAARLGMIDVATFSALQTRLKAAVAALEKPSFLRAIFAVDQALYKALQRGLSITSELAPLAPGLKEMALQGKQSGISEQQIDKELEKRMSLTYLGYQPYLVDGGKRSALDRKEQRPRLLARQAGRQVVAVAEEQIGAGWLHPGVPKGRYTSMMIDRSARFWKQEALEAQTPSKVKALASRLLDHELTGPDPRSTSLTMVGRLELKQKGFIDKLLTIANGSDWRAAVALVALASQNDQRVTALVARAARSADAMLREAAMHAVCIRHRPDESGLLKAAVKDSAMPVAVVAAVCLLEIGDRAALAPIGRWLKNGGDGAMRLLALLQPRSSKDLPAPIKRDVGRLLSTYAQKLAQRGSAARAGRAMRLMSTLLRKKAVTALRALYSKPAVRGLALAEAACVGHAGLLRRALKQNDVSALEQAAPRLASCSLAARELKTLASRKEPLLRLAGRIGLARSGDGQSLLDLGTMARDSCATQALVIPVLTPWMNGMSRRRLFGEVLAGRCKAAKQLVWRLVVKLQPSDIQLLRRGLGHHRRSLRVQAALTALGLRRGAARGQVRVPFLVLSKHGAAEHGIAKHGVAKQGVRGAR
jgi:hypothetical protein